MIPSRYEESMEAARAVWLVVVKDYEQQEGRSISMPPTYIVSNEFHLASLAVDMGERKWAASTLPTGKGYAFFAGKTSLLEDHFEADVGLCESFRTWERTQGLEERRSVLIAALWTDDEKRATATKLTYLGIGYPTKEDEAHRLLVFTSYIKDGDSFPVEPDSAPYTADDAEWRKEFGVAMTTWFTGMMLFAQQPIASIEHPQLNRAIRKRMADHIDTTKVIHLRPRRQTRHDGDYETSDVEWSHRWMVRGHKRNQWFPAEGEHREIWINPYIKGPEDKPLVEKDVLFALDRTA